MHTLRVKEIVYYFIMYSTLFHNTISCFGVLRVCKGIVNYLSYEFPALKDIKILLKRKDCQVVVSVLIIVWDIWVNFVIASHNWCTVSPLPKRWWRITMNCSGEVIRHLQAYVLESFIFLKVWTRMWIWKYFNIL